MSWTDALRVAIKPMRHAPIRNYVLPGLTSSLVGGDGHGTVRLFTSDRETREWVTPHSHRFDFTCLVLAGWVENIIFKPGGGGNDYVVGALVPVEGGMGKYKVERTETGSGFAEFRTTYKAGETYAMRAEEIHSIRFARGASVLFFEGPAETDKTFILEPYVDGRLVPTFETSPWMFDRAQERRT